LRFARLNQHSIDVPDLDTSAIGHLEAPTSNLTQAAADDLVEAVHPTIRRRTIRTVETGGPELDLF
jgi:uncharacterized protein (DUF2384 family)